jgi:hypothetical protein
VRRRAAAIPALQRLIRRDVLQRDWDIGILGRGVALRKIAEDQRATHFDVDF